MKNILTASFVFCSSVLFSQSYWKPINHMGKGPANEHLYQLDISRLRKQLNTTHSKTKDIIIEVPNLEGKLEKFRVKSFPVVDEQLEAQYELGSYTGVSVSDPKRTIRFSIAPNDFQSMIFDQGNYEFIDPRRNSGGIYSVHSKTKKSSGRPFECSPLEDKKAVNQINHIFKLAEKRNKNSLSRFRTSNDRKYRTLRIAISVTGEYTQIFGGVAGALAQINATLTRVNAVYEKDMAVHFNLVNATNIIYTNPAIDPYSDAASGVEGDWSMELQKVLTKEVGEANYDIGHLFGASGGGGNAGCLGCICESPSLNSDGIPTSKAKGSAFTSPSEDNQPYGDVFDIDFVAHEIGHQLGANHTFSYAIENPTSGTQIEPGSGSTIMGYAGMTNYDIQEHSDAYFSIASLNQIQVNLESKTCDHETAITSNTAPQIPALPSYTIPKQTAFVLKTEATDAENDLLTYTWEQTDNATSRIIEVDGNRNNGANFRSVKPSTDGYIRYFPKLETVLAGKLLDNTTAKSNWEAIPNTARNMSFAVTVRDNNAISTRQQVSSAVQDITIGNDGPFSVITAGTLNASASGPLLWNVANTNLAPYNVSFVKIDYTLDNGLSWTVLADSTPNDGSEILTFPAHLLNKTIKIRISAIDNVFYAVSSPIKIINSSPCSSVAPDDFTITQEGRTFVLSWKEYSGNGYKVRYKPKTAFSWTEITTTEPKYVISGLTSGVTYEAQVAQICGGTTGTFTSSEDFVFSKIEYCPLIATNATYEYISNIKITDSSNNVLINNNSDAQGYSDFSGDVSKIIQLKRGSNNNKLSITISYPNSEDFYETLSVWIDFNADGKLSEDERIIKEFIADPSNGNVGTLQKTFSFNVPSTAVASSELLKMRVALKVGPSVNSVPASACDGTLRGTITPKDHYTYGEVEDYGIIIRN